jgi:hypothetical protein
LRREAAVTSIKSSTAESASSPPSPPSPASSWESLTSERLSRRPGERDRLGRERETLLDSATEEFPRFFAPAPGDGRTISAGCEIAGRRFEEGERLWLSWAMAHRDPRRHRALRDHRHHPGHAPLPGGPHPGWAARSSLDETLGTLRKACDE